MGKNSRLSFQVGSVQFYFAANIIYLEFARLNLAATFKFFLVHYICLCSTLQVIQIHDLNCDQFNFRQNVEKKCYFFLFL